MLLLAASAAVTQELYLDEKTMPGVNIIVRCIYGRLFFYLMNSTEIGHHLHKDLSLEEKTMGAYHLARKPGNFGLK